jgi:TIGR00245 family protein
MNGDLDPWRLAASLLLVAVAVAFSLAQRLRLERSIVWASVRALVQLLLVGVALELVIAPGRPLYLAWCWVAAILVYAAVIVQRRAGAAPGVFWIALTAFVAAAVVSLGVLFGLRIFPLEGRTLVPLTGMMVGNAMTATVLVTRRVLGEFRDSRDAIEARLALGLPAPVAARPYLREAVRTALIPQVESTRTVGLIFLPGAMTGLILAGAAPLQATMVQAAIMYLVLGSVATTTAVVALGVRRRLFTPDHRLVLPVKSGD